MQWTTGDESNGDNGQLRFVAPLSNPFLVKAHFYFGRCVNIRCVSVCTNEKSKSLRNVCLGFISQCVFGLYVAGLGGIPAQMGFDAGDKKNFEDHEFSRTSDILKLAYQNYMYKIRSVHPLKRFL